MAYSRNIRSIVLLGLCLLAGLAATSSAAGQAPLRYGLTAGDWMVYERRVRVLPLEGEEVIEKYRDQIQLWCLTHDDQESYLLTDLIRVRDERPKPVQIAVFHLDYRGRLRLPPELLTELDQLDPVFEVVPVLPEAMAGQSEWLTEPDHYGRTRRCRRVAEEADGLARIEFTLEDPIGIAEIRGISQRGAFWFDPDRGVVTRAESETTDRLKGRRILTVTCLHGRARQEPLWCRRTQTEVDQYLRALRLEQRQVERMTTEPDLVDDLLKRIDRVWGELIMELPSRPESALRRAARFRRGRITEDADRFRDRARLARQWLGTEAPQWSLQDPEGRTIRSEMLRDRVVLEYYWSVDSAWSLRGFQLLRVLKQQHAEEDLRILCLNTDLDPASAKRAIQRCGDGFTHVLAGPPVGGQSPSVSPVIRLLDRDGKILAVYFGWQPLLAERISPLLR